MLSSALLTSPVASLGKLKAPPVISQALIDLPNLWLYTNLIASDTSQHILFLVQRELTIDL